MGKSKKDNTEFEAKFYPVDKKLYREKLKKLGARLAFPERKMRRAIFDKAHYPQLNCDYIRVRDEGNVIRLSAKTHAREGGDLIDQQEVDVEVSDYDKTIQLIELTGFKFILYQENTRETWKYKDASIEIDTYPGLESYTEIEATSAEDVKSIAEELGFSWEDKIITSVVEIYMRIYGLPKDEVMELLKYCTFEQNPFSTLKHR